MVASTITLLHKRMRAGVYSSGAYMSPELLPRVGVTSPFSSIERSTSGVVTKIITLTRTEPASASCSVQYALTGGPDNPITSGYFYPAVLPAGTAIFPAGQKTLDIAVTFSPGSKPTRALQGIFTISGATGCTIQNSASAFSFVMPTGIAVSKWTWEEPAWTPETSYGIAPNKVNWTEQASLAGLNALEPGKTYVVNGTLDGAGQTFTLDGLGTSAAPIRIRGRGDTKATYATLRNCTLVIRGNWINITKLNLEGVNIVVQSSQYFQFVRNTITGLDGGVKSAAILVSGRYSAKYTRFYANEFGSFNGKLLRRNAINTDDIENAQARNHYQYIWIERNLFWDMRESTVADGSYQFKSYPLWIGRSNKDADKECFITIKDNLFLDNIGSGLAMEIKVAGNMRITGNTFERTQLSGKTQDLRIRFGSVKTYDGPYPDGNLIGGTGALVQGNLWTVPIGSGLEVGGLYCKDGFHRFVQNWACYLGPSAQPSVSSLIIPGSTIGLLRGNMDYRWWPKNIRTGVKGHYFINAGKCEVGANRLTVVVGAEENTFGAAEAVVRTTDNTVAPALASRLDRNYAVQIITAKSENTNQTKLISGANYNVPPVRMFRTTTGVNAPANVNAVPDVPPKFFDTGASVTANAYTVTEDDFDLQKTVIGGAGSGAVTLSVPDDLVDAALGAGQPSGRTCTVMFYIAVGRPITVSPGAGMSLRHWTVSGTTTSPVTLTSALGRVILLQIANSECTIVA